jgi:fructose-specific phosphotransferase system IIC component
VSTVEFPLMQRILTRLESRPILKNGALATALRSKIAGLPALTQTQKQALLLSAIAAATTSGLLYFGLKKGHVLSEQKEIFIIPAISTVTNNLIQILLKAKYPNI